jgi:hypothetical protein
MLSAIQRRLSYANVVATLALVFAMSGGALAAKHYLINSQQQINPKVLMKLKGKNGRRGATGPAGATGASGAKGETGANGEPGPFPSGSAPAGATIRGNYAAGGPASATGQFFWDQISFGFQFASAPSPHFIVKGAPSTSECPGSPSNPQAAAGNLCVYELLRVGSFVPEVFDPSTGISGKADPWGGGVLLRTTGTGNMSSYGTWAATAP